MSGLTAFLQTELLTLSSEARRKHPEIKEVSFYFVVPFFFLLGDGNGKSNSVFPLFFLSVGSRAFKCYIKKF